MEPHRIPLHSALHSEGGHVFKCRDELRAAIWIAGVVKGIYANEDVIKSERLRQRERVREKEDIASRDIRHWNGLVNGASKRHIGTTGHKSGVLKQDWIETDHKMLLAPPRGKLSGPLQFNCVTLAIMK